MKIKSHSNITLAQVHCSHMLHINNKVSCRLKHQNLKKTKMNPQFATKKLLNQ